MTEQQDDAQSAQSSPQNSERASLLEVRRELDRLLENAVLPAALLPAHSEMRALLAGRKGGAPLEREHYLPGHFTASAFVLSPDDGALLLIHHQKLGLWLQPGGHFEPGDRSLSGAARRELREETGVEAVEELDVLFDLDVHAIPARGSVPGHLHFDVRVLLRAETWELAPSQEVRGARWVGLDELAAPDAALSDGSVWRVAAALRDGRPGAARG